MLLLLLLLQVPITPELVLRLGKANAYKLSNLAGTMWAPTLQWIYTRPHDSYYACERQAAANCERDYPAPACCMMVMCSAATALLGTVMT
jgi:hypothetical protein